MDQREISYKDGYSGDVRITTPTAGSLVDYVLTSDCIDSLLTDESETVAGENSLTCVGLWPSDNCFWFVNAGVVESCPRIEK